MSLVFGVDYYPEHWPQERWQTDLHLMKQSGLQLVRLAEFAWAQLEPAENAFNWGWLDQAIDMFANAGVQVMLGTPTAAPPAWLVRQYPDVLPVNDIRRLPHFFGGRRHYCPNSPTYHAHTRRIVSAMAERYAGHEAVVGWQIDNEFGGGRTARCYCVDCERAFRAWLKAKYETIDALNTAWGTAFWSQWYDDWSQIEPPIPPDQKPNASQVLDYYRFMSDSWVAYQQLQIDELRPYMKPNDFITHNLMGHFNDINYFDLAKPYDFVSWDNYPTGQADRNRDPLYLDKAMHQAENAPYAYEVGDPFINGMAHDMMRSFLGKPYWIMEQQPGYINWGTWNPTPRPGSVRLWTWEDIAHGTDVTIFFRWRATIFAQEQYHSGLLKHDGTPEQGLLDVQSMQPEQALIAEIQSSTVPAEVAIIHSYDDLWALKLQPHNPEYNYRRHQFTYYRALTRVGVPVDFVPPTADLSKYKLVIAPTLHLVDQAITDNLTRYVEAGGNLLLSVRSGVKTSSNLMTTLTLPGLLKPLIGASIERWHSIPPKMNYAFEADFIAGDVPVSVWAESLLVESAEVIGRFAGGPLQDEVAACRNQVGAGTVIYLGAFADDLLARFLLNWLLPQADVDTVPPLTDGLKLMRRTNDTHEYLFLLNFTDDFLSADLDASQWSVVLTDTSSSFQVAPRSVAVYKRDRL